MINFFYIQERFNYCERKYLGTAVKECTRDVIWSSFDKVYKCLIYLYSRTIPLI